MSAVERAIEASSVEQANERVTERYERTSKRRSEWPSTLRVEFIVFQPAVERPYGKKDSKKIQKVGG